MLLKAWLSPVYSWSVVLPGPARGLTLLSVPSVFWREIIHFLSQVGQLDQTLLQVLLQLGYLQLQGQDGLTKHRQDVESNRHASDRTTCLYVCLGPVAGAGLQRVSSLLCLHASAERRLGSVVMLLSPSSVFRTSLHCKEVKKRV